MGTMQAPTRTLDNNHGNSSREHPGLMMPSSSSHHLLSQKSHHQSLKGGIIISSRHKSSSSSHSPSPHHLKSFSSDGKQQQQSSSSLLLPSSPSLCLPSSRPIVSSSSTPVSSPIRIGATDNRGFSTAGSALLQSPSRSVHQVSESSANSSSQPQEESEEDGADERKVDPFKLVETDLNNLYQEIRRELWTRRPELEEIAGYYFDGQGKAFRPMIVVLVARALNYHVNRVPDLIDSQKSVAMVAEMIHTASLVHDDVIDTADTRRGKASVNVLWGQKKAILAGDYIISRASQMLARLRNDDVIFALSQVSIICRHALNPSQPTHDYDLLSHSLSSCIRLATFGGQDHKSRVEKTIIC